MLLKNDEKTYEINTTGFKVTSYDYKSDDNFLKSFMIYILIFLLILVASFILFSIINCNSDKISHGIFIKNIDVSGLTKEEAINKVKTEISKKMPEDIKLHYNDFETTISLDQIEASFDINKAINQAYEISNPEGFLKKDITTIKLLTNNINIEPTFYINKDALTNVLNDISTKLPGTIIQSSYYIEDDTLFITPGHSGPVVNVPDMENIILSAVRDLSYYNTSIEILTQIKNPKPIDVDAIHNEIYEEPVNAYFSQNPLAVFPHKNGLDFDMTVDEVKKMLASGEKEEYSVPLKTIIPAVTTNMIGMEAFPDYISTYSTKYSTSDKDRTTNLILAANKINGTVLMPGETFSYNKIVGRRTIAAGYKEAKIYQDGQVIDGLGGGICQISSTLFNAVLYANLEIVERRNHQFVPSYVTAGRDATVVYGSQDFKFKNNRNYPIKINCSVNGGIAKFDIYGLKESNEYNVDVYSKINSRTSNAINSVTYRTLSLNGKKVKTEVICKDTYKVH